MWVLIAVEIPSLFCVVHLFRRRAQYSLPLLAFWSVVVLLLPLLGPLFYGAARPPKVKRQESSLVDSEWLGAEGYPRIDGADD
jgi:hypothetical protein